jgi:hypothetical protein
MRRWRPVSGRGIGNRLIVNKLLILGEKCCKSVTLLKSEARDLRWLIALRLIALKMPLDNNDSPQ